jgi:hypothetical protein
MMRASVEDNGSCEDEAENGGMPLTMTASLPMLFSFFAPLLNFFNFCSFKVFVRCRPGTLASLAYLSLRGACARATRGVHQRASGRLIVLHEIIE